jgi:hypothetical protein
LQGNNFQAGTAALIPGAPSIVGLNPDRSMRTGDQPFAGGIAITPNDSTDVTATHRALWIGTGGTLSAVVLGSDGTTRNTIATTVGDGSVFPMRVLRVNATGTTATGIVAGW